MARRGLLWSCLCLALGTSPSVSAQLGQQDSQSGQAQLSGADQEARALFMAAQVAFDEGRFESAVQYFLQSYRLSQRPELLYNIGNTYDRLQQPEQALEYFDRYLRERPNAENHLQVEARVRLLRQSVSARQAQPHTSSTPSAPSTEAAVPTPQQTAQAHVEANEPAAIPPAAPQQATRAEDDSGPYWLLWGGVGAAVIAATVVTVVIATSGSTTQEPLVPQDGAHVVRL
jgi:tetratricopeptide (TPR) repeat protein